MIIHRLAKTSHDIDQCLWLRHEIFIRESGRMPHKRSPARRMVDKYDAFLSVSHVLALDGAEPIATMRVSIDTGMGLPPEALFDFSAYRKSAGDDAILGSGSYIGVRKQWRGRDDVLLPIFTAAATVIARERATDLIVIVTQDVAALISACYGFVALSAPFHNKEVSDIVVPMAAEAEQFISLARARYDWRDVEQFDSDVSNIQDKG